MRRVLGGMLVLLVGAVSGLVGPASPACACSCMRLTEAEAYERASTVFAATLVRRGEAKDGQSSLTQVTMEFVVDAVYKGEVRPVQKVLTAASSASCGLEVPVGQRYLVHASPSEDGSALQTTLCDGNRPLDGTPKVAGAAARPVVDNAGGEAAAPPAVRQDSPGMWNDWRGATLGVFAGLGVLAALGVVLLTLIRRRRV